jgi:hypothetical protein
MNPKLSKALFAFSVLLCVVACGLSILWLRIAMHREGFEALGFVYFVGPIFCAHALAGVISSAALFAIHGQPRERKSLWLSGCAFSVVAIESIVLLTLPLIGC